MSKKANLKELVDPNELQTIQDSFAKLVGTSSVIFSPEGELLTQFSNPTGFCALIQSTEEGKRRCFMSFMGMSQKALELKEPIIQYCFVHGGHFVAPIIIDGEHKGTMFAGQFISQKFSAEQLKALDKIAVEIHVDPTLLVEESKKMRVVEEDAVRNYSSLLFQIVEVIARLGAQADELNRAKDALQKAYNELEIRVQERTTELAKTNADLRLFLHAVDSSIEGIAMGDLEGRITYVNETFVRMFGYSSEELMGKEIALIYPENQLPKLEKALEATMDGGWTGELVAKRKDGQLFPIAVASSLITDDEGNAIAHMASHQDIIERKRIERILKESEERFRTIFDRAVDGIFLLDLDTRRFYMANNAICQMLGYTVEELTNMGPADIIPKEDLPWVMKTIEQAIGEKISGGAAIPMQRKDGSVIHTNINGAMIEFGGTKYLLGIIRDITELKKKTEALKRFNKLAVGRELKMIELKKEINVLLEQLGEEPRYKIVGEG